MGAYSARFAVLIPPLKFPSHTSTNAPVIQTRTRVWIFRAITEPHKTMQLTKQLAIFLDNRPGTLARVCDTLSEAKINIYAITTSDTVDHSVVRLVVSDPRRALLLFEQYGALVVDDDVILIEGDNKPGSLATICKKLSAAKVNIEYCYCATSPGAKKGLLVLRTSNPKKALKVLNT